MNASPGASSHNTGASTSSSSSRSLLTNSNGVYDYITISYCLVFTICMVLEEVLLEHVFVYSKSLQAEKVQFSTSMFADCVTLCQFFWCSVISILKLNFRVKFSRNIKLLLYYLLLTALIFGATGLATMSLNYVTYPTKVVFKSAKLVPAMLINTLIMGMVISKDHVAL